MKPTLIHLALGALTLVPALASAQPGAPAPAGGYYAPPPPAGYYAQPAPAVPGGFHDRTGRLALGFSIGLGGMKSNDEAIGCIGCESEPLAVEFDFHIGGMLSPRFALLFEVQANAQTIAENESYADTLVSGAAMVAGQYWVHPQLWIKAGIGGASLEVSRDDGYYAPQESPSEEGVAVMGAIGYEVFSSRRFGIDLQGRLISASYDGIGENISSGTIGLGFNWY